ncbi:Fpg/Nei family DNA glycosylase [Agromyces archimandritae]|uniref:DNA-(apurinic or apyrimidinic site) lyase n=1 Tax=Agromyces archimandritae TaxID=2781962 RepID=A0A975FL85_9MICO|nr:Fpg/Nei family DNA glycosylase [Agromyces archimandritae]QTX04560.1 Fpg/Nei family DNA glycosylase [Agromyces archimandritae]
MPEGHSVHRIARQFERNFVGHRVHASSPQGRFAAGAAEIDGRRMTDARAIGKQMFLGFEGDRWLRVHLGMYGAWDFAGEILMDATIASANGRMGQTNQRGTFLDSPNPDAIYDTAGENSVTSIGAPRKARLRMAESEKQESAPASFPPEPVGQVRVRLLTDTVCADLRGPTACEVLDPAQVETVVAKLGPDPLIDPGADAESRFAAAVRKKRTAIGLLLMDQSVVAGIGNVYRAELLFRARQNPHTPGASLPEEHVRHLWQDWAKLLKVGVETGQMMTMDDLEPEAYRKAMASRADRHWVYKREGLPCRVCGTNIVLEEMGNRKLYWCPYCQA